MDAHGASHPLADPTANSFNAASPQPETATLSLTRKLLDVQGLSIAFATDRGQSTVVRDLDLHVSEGETLAIVGESGSGKSVTALASRA